MKENLIIKKQKIKNNRIILFKNKFETKDLRIMSLKFLNPLRSISWTLLKILSSPMQEL